MDGFFPLAETTHQDKAQWHSAGLEKNKMIIFFDELFVCLKKITIRRKHQKLSHARKRYFKLLLIVILMCMF